MNQQKTNVDESIIISFDTSCLNDILNDDQATNVLATALASRSCTEIVVSGYALTELFAGKRTDLISKRMKNFIRLWGVLTDNRIHLTPMISQMLLAELNKKTQQTPTISPRLKLQLRDSLTSSSNVKSEGLSRIIESCGRINNSKNDVFELDKRAASFLKEKGFVTDQDDISKIESYFEKYENPCDLLRWFFEGSFDNIGWKGERPSLEKIAKDDRYQIYRLFLAMTELTILGAAFKGKSSHLILSLFGPDKGNWYDSLIVASAARAHYFITKDCNQSKKIEFLNGRRITHLKSLSYEDFLQNKQSVMGN